MNEMRQNIKKESRLAAINIVTGDPKRLAAFYRDVLGAKIDETHGGPNRIEIVFGNWGENTVFIAANYHEGFMPQNVNCLRGFELRVGDANAEYVRIQNLGIKIKEPPKDLPWGYRFFCITDPDGNEIDLVERL